MGFHPCAPQDSQESSWMLVSFGNQIWNWQSSFADDFCTKTSMYMGFSSHVWRNWIVVIVCILNISQSAGQLYCSSAHPLDFWTWFCHVCRWLTLNSLNLTIYCRILHSSMYSWRFRIAFSVRLGIHQPVWQIMASQAKEARNKALLNGDVQVVTLGFFRPQRWKTYLGMSEHLEIIVQYHFFFGWTD